MKGNFTHDLKGSAAAERTAAVFEPTGEAVQLPLSELGIGSSQDYTYGYINGDFTTLYKTPPQPDLSSSGAWQLSSSTLADVYAKYDALVSAYPNAVSRSLLGYGPTSTGAENASLPIYEYTFEPPGERVPTGLNTGNETLRPAPLVLVAPCMHSDEKATAWCTAVFFEQLMNNWHTSDSLASLRANVRFKVVPVVNVSGYNNHSRNNIRGVDLNRNFTDASPQRETVIMKNWLLANSDAFLYIDYHNFRWDQGGMSYHCTPYEGLKWVYSSLIRRLTLRWYRDYNITTVNNYSGGFMTNSVVSTGGAYFAIYTAGIAKSVTLEFAKDPYSNAGSANWYNSQVIESGIDLLVNYLLGVIDFANKRPDLVNKPVES